MTNFINFVVQKPYDKNQAGPVIMPHLVYTG